MNELNDGGRWTGLAGLSVGFPFDAVFCADGGSDTDVEGRSKVIRSDRNIAYEPSSRLFTGLDRRTRDDEAVAALRPLFVERQVRLVGRTAPDASHRLLHGSLCAP